MILLACLFIILSGDDYLATQYSIILATLTEPNTCLSLLNEDPIEPFFGQKKHTYKREQTINETIKNCAKLIIDIMDIRQGKEYLCYKVKLYSKLSLTKNSI